MIERSAPKSEQISRIESGKFLQKDFGANLCQTQGCEGGSGVCVRGYKQGSCNLAEGCVDGADAEAEEGIPVEEGA